MELTVSEDGANCVGREAIDEGVGCNWMLGSEVCEGEILSADGLKNVAVLGEVGRVEAKNVIGTEGWWVRKVIGQLTVGVTVWGRGTVLVVLSGGFVLTGTK